MVQRFCGSASVVFFSVQDAEELHFRVVAGRTAVLGPDAPDTLRSLHNLGAVLIDAGRPKEAETLLR